MHSFIGFFWSGLPPIEGVEVFCLSFCLVATCIQIVYFLATLSRNKNVFLKTMTSKLKQKKKKKFVVVF